MSIYSELILDNYENPRNVGVVKKPSKRVSVSNPLCGDAISMSVRIKKGRVAEIKFEGTGCAISQASSSMLTEYVKGKEIVLLKNLDKKFIIMMLGVELGVNRLKCALLPLEALKKLLVEY